MKTFFDARRLARRMTPKAIKFYHDARANNALLPMIARVGNKAESPPSESDEIPYNVKWAFPEVREWLDERTIQEWQISETIYLPIRDFEWTGAVTRAALRHGTALHRLNEALPEITSEFQHFITYLALDPLRHNRLAIDGQNLFSDNHKNPQGESYGNSISNPTRATPGKPTYDEAARDLKTAFSLLLANQIRKKRVIRYRRDYKQLIVVVRDSHHANLFADLAELEKINDNTNLLRNTFEIVLDVEPKPGTEQSFDVIHAAPNSPRPSFVVPVETVSELYTKDDKLDNRSGKRIVFGMDASWAVGTGFPQTAVRVG